MALKLCALLFCACAQGLKLPAAVANTASRTSASRRWFVQAAGATASLGLAARVGAEEPFSKMGGLLEPFIDTSRGFKLYKPTGWTQYEADPGNYDVKFADIIDPFETVIVATQPVQTATSVSALGELDAVGAKFAKSRNAELVSATSREADGSLVYTLDLKGEMYRELLVLSINKGKLFRLSTVATNKRWNKRGELYKNIVASFVPKGF